MAAVGACCPEQGRFHVWLAETQRSRADLDRAIGLRRGGFARSGALCSRATLVLGVLELFGLRCTARRSRARRGADARRAPRALSANASAIASRCLVGAFALHVVTVVAGFTGSARFGG